MTDPEPHYTFTCPSCSGNFSILLERIPPVQARFRCPHCQQPMDFPSREEARVYARLQAQGAAPPAAAPPAPPPVVKAAARPTPKPFVPDPSEADGGGKTFRVEKQGFENDVFDRRGIRNMIRTGEVTDADFVSVDDAAPVSAGQVPFLKSLFKLRSTSTAVPPARCRTHTEKMAFYRCKDTGRPLCEDCAEEKKFGNAIVRTCAHCGGTIEEFDVPSDDR